MKTYILLFFLSLIFYLPLQSYAQSKKPSLKLKITVLAEDNNGIPHSVIKFIDANKKVVYNVKVAGLATEINKSEFSTYQIPANAIAASSSWWAGAGNYFYAIKSKSGKIAIYKGWQEEEQTDKGYHWKKVK